MGEQLPIKPQLLRGADWDDFARRFPDAYQFLWLLASHNELQQMGDDVLTGEELEHKRKLLWQLADHSGSRYRWDHRFLI